MSLNKKFVNFGSGDCPEPPPASGEIVPFKMKFGVPEIPYGIASPPSVTSAFSQTSTSHILACIFPVIKTGTLTKIHLKYAVSNVSNVYDFRVETVSSGGTPSGTLWGTNTNQTYTSVNGAVEQTITLTEGAVFNNINETFALVHKITTFVGNASLQGYSDGSAGDFFPYLTSSSNNGSTWGARTLAPSFALEYSDGTFLNYNGNFPISEIGTTVLTNSSNPRMSGNKFNLPIKARAIGVWCNSDNDDDFNINVYDSNSTLVRTLSVDGDLPISLAASTTIAGYFSTPLELEKNSDYYVMLESRGSGNITSYNFTILTPSPLSSLNSGELAIFCTTSTNSPTTSSDFSISNNKQSFVGLIFDAFESI